MCDQYLNILKVPKYILCKEQKNSPQHTGANDRCVQQISNQIYHIITTPPFPPSTALNWPDLKIEEATQHPLELERRRRESRDLTRARVATANLRL